MPEQTEEENVEQSNDTSSVAVKVWEPEDGEDLKEELKDEKTKEELQEEARKKNEERGVTQHDDSYIKTSAAKEELATGLSDIYVKEETDGPLVDSDVHTETGIKLRQLEVHPANERFDVDYKDPKLYKSLVQSGNFTNVPIVTPVTDNDGNVLKNEYGETRYRIVGGNRSVETFKSFLENEVDFEAETEFDSVDEWEIDVLVKEYLSDDQDANYRQELMDISNDNEAALEPSPVARARQYKRMAESGETQKGIANKTGKRQSQISKAINMVETLPDRMLFLIHCDYHSSRFAKLSEEELDKQGIPYRQNADGETVVEGMTQSNGDVVIDMLKSYSEEEGDQIWMDLEDMFLTEEGIDKACKLKRDDFYRWAHEKAVEDGILDESVLQQFGDVSGGGDTDSDTSQQTSSSSSSSSSSTSVETGSTDTSEQQQSTSDTSGESSSESEDEDDGMKTTRQQIRDLPYRNDQIAEELREGTLQFTEDFEEKFAEAVELNHPKMEEAAKAMIFHDIIEEA